MARKRKRNEAPDDPTFATMTEDAPRKRKTKPEPPRIDPWDAVAAECPCRVSAESHRDPINGVVRVHIVATGQPILCVPGTLQGRCAVPSTTPGIATYGHSKQWNTDLWAAWRTSDAYLTAELVR